MLSTHCCSCLSVFILGPWITTKFQLPKLNFTFSCFHLEASYYFSPLKFHTLADPEVWVERGALVYSFAIGGSVTGFSNLGQILYKIQSDSNSLPFTYACHKSCSPSQSTYTKWKYTGKLMQPETESFAQETQEVWHEEKRTVQIHESRSSFLSTNWWDITHAEQLGISLTLRIRNCEHIVTAFSPISTANPKAGAGEKGKEAKLSWAR